MRLFLLIICFLVSTPVWALNIKTGSYTGNAADNRNISGVGFQPDFVLIRGQNSSSGSVKTSSMAGDSAFKMDAGSLAADMIQALSADGFQLGTNSEVNQNAITFSYIAIKADGTNFAVGTYAGTGVDAHAITGVGFQPSGCFIRHDSGSFREPSWTSSSMAANTTFLGADGQGSTSNLIKTLDSDGFTLGTSSYVNASSDTYYYACWKDSSGLMKTGTYTGNATDNRSITGIGFQPTFVWAQGGATGFLQAHLPGSGASTDETYRFYLRGSDTDMIQALEADGFQIGADANINTNATLYYYWAIKDGGATGGGGGGGSTLPNSLL